MRAAIRNVVQLFSRTRTGNYRRSPLNQRLTFDLPLRYVSTSKLGLSAGQAQASVQLKFKMGKEESDLSLYILPLDSPVVKLDCDVAFNGLTSKEKLYAHYLSQAAWYGGMISAVQSSPETPPIFSLLLDLFKSNGVEGLREVAVKQCNFTEDDWKGFVIYTTGVLSNAGNYKSFGDTKIIPAVSAELVEDLISKSKFLGMIDEEVKEKWAAAKTLMYSLTDQQKQLGLGDKGITMYFSANCTQDDSKIVNRFMKDKNMEGWMTRVFKTSNGSTCHYEIRTAAVNSSQSEAFTFENSTFTLTTGDYSYFLEAVCKNLGKAKEYAANDTEVSMLDCYIKCFKDGSLEEHKNGSRLWVKDKGCAVETYIGFIENYRDPAGIRSEFEAFVSMVNRPMSERYQILVENAPEFIELLPWPKEFEKDAFLKPDFTSLDVLTFASSGIPSGINIPNYDEIRQDEGFKNVYLGNVVQANMQQNVIPFLSEEDKTLYKEYRLQAFEVHVALHELLGHGCGKLLKVDHDGAFNFPAGLQNPITKKPVSSWYGPTDTYSSVFGSLSSAWEECRAESVGLYLSLFDDILKVLGVEGDVAKHIKDTNWLLMVYAGVKGLEMYQASNKSWGQAHSKARFVILRVLVEAGQGLVTVAETVGEDGKPDLLISLDYTKVDTVGREAMKEFLMKLNVLKATADIKEATELFEGYAAVNDDGPYPWAKWREIVLAKKQPRKAFVQSNTVLNGDAVELKTYEATHEGLIQSWIDRFEGNDVYKGLDACWRKDQPHF